MKNRQLCEIRQKQLQEIADSFTEPDGQEYEVYVIPKESTPLNELNHQLPDDEGLDFNSWSLH